MEVEGATVVGAAVKAEVAWGAGVTATEVRARAAEGKVTVVEGVGGLEEGG